jgi:hypothetical protein
MTYDDGNNVFGKVTRIAIEAVDSFPLLEIVPQEFSLGQRDLTYGYLLEGFSFYVHESLANSTTDAQATEKIGRLLEIKGLLLQYLQQVPNPLRDQITDVSVFDVRYEGGNTMIAKDVDGIDLVLQINFNVRIKVDDKEER